MSVFYYYCLLLLFSTNIFATKFGKNGDQFKVSPEENLAKRIIDGHGLKRPCGKHNIKPDAHKSKNYTEVIIFFFIRY